MTDSVRIELVGMAQDAADDHSLLLRADGLRHVSPESQSASLLETHR